MCCSEQWSVWFGSNWNQMKMKSQWLQWVETRGCFYAPERKKTKISQGESEWEWLLCLLSIIDMAEAWLCLFFLVKLHRGCAARVRSSQCSSGQQCPALSWPGPGMDDAVQRFVMGSAEHGVCCYGSAPVLVGDLWLVLSRVQHVGPLECPWEGCCGISI